MIQPSGACGVRMAGTGSAVPEKILTNDDLSRILDTTDEWITQRTGIRCRRVTLSSKCLAPLALASSRSWALQLVARSLALPLSWWR